MSLEGKKIEDKTVDRLMDDLTKNLEVEDIVDKCLSKELITADNLASITAKLNAGKKTEAVRELMLHIKRSAPGYLETFYGILLDSKSSFLAPYVAEGMEMGATWKVPGYWFGEVLGKRGLFIGSLLSSKRSDQKICINWLAKILPSDFYCTICNF